MFVALSELALVDGLLAFASVNYTANAVWQAKSSLTNEDLQAQLKRLPVHEEVRQLVSLFRPPVDWVAENLIVKGTHLLSYLL